MEEIVYREMKPEDIPSLLELFAASFGKPAPRAHWDWKYSSGPEKSVVVVAEADHKIVGHYAVLPRTVLVGSKPVRAGLVVDVMTHPDYGRRGIFVKSAVKAFEACGERGISILLGFPNEAAIRGHQKVNWSEIGSLRLLVRPLTVNPVPQIMGGRQLPKPVAWIGQTILTCLSRVTVSSGSELRTQSLSAGDFLSLGAELEDLLANAWPTDSVKVARTTEWLHWRLAEPGTEHRVVVIRGPKESRILGAALLNVRDYRNMRVGAVFSLLLREDSSRVVEDLLRGALHEALSKKCDVVVMLESPAMNLAGAARKTMLLRVPRKLRYIVRGIEGTEHVPEVMRFSKWHIELIDHDVL